MNSNKTDNEIMSKPHWAVIKDVTTHHEGDERSRTNPGHGYPAHTTSAKVYTPFETEAGVLAYMNNRNRSTSNYVVIKAEPLKVTTSLSLKGG